MTEIAKKAELAVNTGKGCAGFGNIGDYNIGNYNSGDRNSGDCNIGVFNSGNYNSGDCNIGSFNSGNYNSGNYNSGNWNKCSFSSGCFNTKSPKIYLFNKPSKWTYKDWLYSEARYLMNQIPESTPRYVYLSDMTVEEKAAHPEAEITGGYLKVHDGSESERNQIWWDNLTNEQRDVIKELPNFDKDIFKKITGIDVAKD